MEQTIYKVHTDIFEGPIELLVRLIQERKLPINEVSLVRVTDDYLAKMNTMEISYNNMTQFLVIASTLVLIKSRSLLPQMELDEEEEQDIQELERRLRLYAIFQKLSAHIEDALSGNHMRMRLHAEKKDVFAPDDAITPKALHEMAFSVFENLPEKEKLEKAQITTIVRIEDMMERLTKRVQSEAHISFNTLVQKNRRPTTKQEAREIKVEVVVGFLALLEMVRNGILSVMQDANFNDITIEKRS